MTTKKKKPNMPRPPKPITTDKPWIITNSKDKPKKQS